MKLPLPIKSAIGDVVRTLNVPDAPLTDTAQNIIPIADIVDDMILLKDGGAAIVFESTSLNFSLLSEKEQEAVITAYAALLNSLSFSIQILIRSQRKDISSYILYLDESLAKLTNPLLHRLMLGYKTFITETIKKRNVLSKKFYLIIPFSALELGVTKSILTLTKRKGPLPFSKSYVFKKAKTVLYPKRDHLVRQAGRLGLRLKQLTNPELIEIFYDIYNPRPQILKRKEDFTP